MAHLDVRREGDVTASDVPAICGECPFQTRKSVLYKKALKLRSVDNPTTMHGRVTEPIALEKFCQKTGAVVVDYPCGYVKHPQYNWFGGTMDAKVKMPNGDVVIVEIKCPVSRAIYDEVPGHYYGQVQSYLFVDQTSPYALFVQYKPAGPRSLEKLQVTRVERDNNYMSLRLNSLRRFWEELQIWSGYIEKIVTVLQRAWRAYVLKKAADKAAKQSMMSRLKCAKIVGKIAGFCRVRDARVAAGPYATNWRVSRDPDDTNIYIVSEDVYSAYSRPPPEAKRFKKTEEIMIVD